MYKYVYLILTGVTSLISIKFGISFKWPKVVNKVHSKWWRVLNSLHVAVVALMSQICS